MLVDPAVFIQMDAHMKRLQRSDRMEATERRQHLEWEARRQIENEAAERCGRE